NFNIAFNRTKTIQLNSGQNEIRTDPQWDVQFMQTEYQYITEVGQPVGMMYGFVFDGLYQMDDFSFQNGTYTLKEGIPTHVSVTKPGMVRFKDVNGDGITNRTTGRLSVTHIQNIPVGCSIISSTRRSICSFYCNGRMDSTC